ncbi:MAG: sulfatase-like hydrolase/transferase [Candidatus Aminicenantes bacterium]|nr:sulfatase-like hydrolase/transferase [Candidatus Aminicenantes bacterium]
MAKKAALKSILLLIPLFALALGNPVAASAALPKDTNILLITIDTLRYDRVGILSDKYVKTPHLDGLARRSVIFTRAFAHDTLTRPSHANILTGTTALYHGVIDNPGFRLESRYVTLAEYLKDKKYRTGAFIGAFVLDARCGLAEGFDLYNDDNGEQSFGEFGFVERRADRVVQPAMEWMAGQREKWFCWIHLFDPHDPYEPPEPFRQEYKNDLYSGEVAFVDAQLGVLFDALEKSGLLEKTVIIVTSDHGEALGEKDEITHGFFAYNNTLHVPLFLYVPGSEPKTVGENACHVDIFPTVCDLLGLPLPPHLQGESLLPMIEGRERKNKSIYFESLSPNISMDCAPLTGFIQGNQKFIDLPVKEVYDLSLDYEEENNLASTIDLQPLVMNLETLKAGLKGKGTKQDLKGKGAEILPLLQSLGYISGTPAKKKSYGVADDPKTLQPVITQLRQAILESQSGRLDAALKKIQTILRIRPTYVTAYSALAKIYFNYGRADQAVATLKDGLAKNPYNLHLEGNLGIMLVIAKKPEEAIPVLRDCTEKAKYNPEYVNYLGLAYMNLGEFEPAREQFQKALKIDPTLVAGFNNLGYLHLLLYVQTKDEKQLDSAIKNFDKALAFDPERRSAVKGKETALGYLGK